MATIANTSYQATEHQVNTGETRMLAKWTWTLDNSSHATNDALSLVETISGAARVDGFSTRACFARVIYSVSSGTPAPKDMHFYLISKTGIPATAPVLSTGQVWAQTDAPYVLGKFDFIDSDFDISDKIATACKEVSIDCINEDTTPGTSIYCMAINGQHTWTPAAGSKLEVSLWFKMS
jgi:hypothetical protein